MSLLAEFKIRFPEFNSESDPRIQMFLDDASLNIDSSIWGNKAELGQLYLAAHYLYEANKPSGAVGILTSRSVDGFSESYTARTIDTDFEMNKYGIRYLQYRKSLGAQIWLI